MASTKLLNSLVRGSEVLRLVAASDEGLPLRDVAASLELKPPTAHNLLQTLVATHLLEKTEHPVRYRLGPAIWELAWAYREHAILDGAAYILPDLFSRLRSVFKEPFQVRPPGDTTVTLGREIANEVIMALRVDPERPAVLQRPGRTYHPYGSPVALVFQACWDDQRRTLYRQRYPFWETGAPLWKTESALEAFLDEIRRDGLAVTRFTQQDFIRVAVPVFGHDHELIAVLGGGRWVRMSGPRRRKYVGLVIEAAEALGRYRVQAAQ